MPESPAQILAFLRQAHAFVQALDQTRGKPAERVVLLAQTLHELWPSALSVCLLRRQQQSLLCVLDKTGERRPEWIEPLRKVFEAREATEESPRLADWKIPAGLGPAGSTMAVAPIVHGQRTFGYLAVAAPKARSSERGRALQILLAREAEHLALWLALEERQDAEAMAGTISPRPTLKTCLLDLAYVVAHEFNNILNNMMLQLAVLDYAGSNTGNSADLSAVRQQGTKAAALVRRFQQLSHTNQPPLVPVDLNQLILNVAGELESSGGARGPSPERPEQTGESPRVAALRLRLATDLPPVSGTESDLRCLLILLIESASEAGSSQAVTVRTLVAKEGVLFCVEDQGPPAPPNLLPHLFEPFAAVRNDESGWKLAVCKIIVRRLQGDIHGENRKEGGMALIVKLRRSSIAAGA
jgi:signal transduction histidine kinase